MYCWSCSRPARCCSLLWLLIGSLKTNIDILTASAFSLPVAPQWVNYLHAWTLGGFHNISGTARSSRWFRMHSCCAWRHRSGSRSPGEVFRPARVVRAGDHGDGAAAADRPDLAVPAAEGHGGAEYLPGADPALHGVSSVAMRVCIARVFRRAAGRALGAAQLDGASAWQTFLRILLPLTRPCWSHWGC